MNRRRPREALNTAHRAAEVTRSACERFLRLSATSTDSPASPGLQDPGPPASPGQVHMTDNPAADSHPLNQADHHKHMEFVQGVIARLAGNSFLIKSWTIPVSVAILGYAIVHSDWRVAALGLLTPLAFWYFDSYFLHSETRWRALFRDVASGKIQNFLMPYDKYKISRARILFSSTLRWFYGPIVVLALIVVMVTASDANARKPLEDPPMPHPSCQPSTAAQEARCCPADHHPSAGRHACAYGKRSGMRPYPRS